jgi:hypothetical protein
MVIPRKDVLGVYGPHIEIFFDPMFSESKKI